MSGGGNSSFFTASDIATSADGATSVYAADMDGDGDMDIVSASSIDNTIAWYENNGAADPSWTKAVIATSAGGARSVYAADMDGDGDMDIVSASGNDDTIAWYENNGAADPSCTAADIATSADGAYSVFAADMDGDGDMDIISASTNDDTIAWYENNGAADPSWTKAVIATNADGARSVYAADMDGDGDMDIISASFVGDSVSWYENNNGDGSSWTATDIATDKDNAISVYAADMDGDGDMDIVSASARDDTIAWYENNGAADPSFTAADIATSADGATSVYAADMDGDGDMDIVSASTNDDTIAWYENNGAADPSWTKAVIATNADGAWSVYAADMDGDGDMDIVSASGNDDTIAWYENTGFSYNYSWDVDSGGAPADGTYRATVSGTASATGGAYSGTESITFTLDTTAPTVTLLDTDTDNVVSNSQVVTITAIFSETMAATPTISITGIVTNVIMTPIAGTTSYTYRWDTSSGTLTTGNYAATVSGTDLIGNAYVAGTQSITFSVDTTSPTLTITTPSGPKFSNSSLVVTLTYNEAVTGLTTDTSQFSEATNVASLQLLSASSDGRTYTLRITPQAEGLVKLTHAPGSPPVKDLAGNSIASTVSCSFTYDTTGPTVTLSDTDDDNFLAASDTVTITAFFNEAMTATPTISISGTSISNQVMTQISGTNSYTYNWDVDSGGAPSDGTYSATVAGADLAGNAYSGTDSITFTLDTTAPTVSLSDTDIDNIILTDSGIVTITASFSEVMTATPTISITGIVTNVIMTTVSGTNSYTYAWDTSSGSISDGTYSATVSGTDLIGNPYAGTESITFKVDKNPPTVVITDNDADDIISSSSNVLITATFSEPMASAPKITIGDGVTNANMTSTSPSVWTYTLDMSNWSGTASSATVSITGTDLVGNSLANKGIVTDNLVLNINADTPNVLSGATVNDASSRNNNFTNFGATLVTSNSGNYFDFSSGDYFRSVNNGKLQGMTNRFPITVSARIKTTNSNDQYILTIGRSPASFDGESIFNTRSGYVSQWSFRGGIGYSNTNNQANRSTVQINDGQWHDITWVNTGSDESSGIKIYIDGVLNKTVTGSTRSNFYNNVYSFIGKDGRDNNDKFVGQISKILVYNTGLTDAQVNQNFTGQDNLTFTIDVSGPKVTAITTSDCQWSLHR